MADAKYKMSRERYEEIAKELEYLQTVREKEVSELIKEARSYGDLSENSEYDEAKTEQGKLYSKIAEYKNLLENAEIVEHSTRNGVISIGSRVTVRDVGLGKEAEYQIHLGSTKFILFGKWNKNIYRHTSSIFLFCFDKKFKLKS